MSDKLSDERREHLEFIERCDPAFLIMHLRNDTAFNADALESVFQLAKERARELLAASPAPAITMPPLTDAMRAVLTNENCIYGTPDELYAALVMAAPAISESEDAVRWIATSDRLPSPAEDVLVAVEFFEAGDWRIKVGYFGEQNGWHVFGGSWKPTHWMPLPTAPIDAALAGEKS
ncbi:DUF551 domain-containing protein [Burkholderia gladioli]|uniref:DUF551 domain-containing protein n=1 Tax=Burkholderia gladioli TaxID=28095 RepID=UPI00163F1615|nr:DUF551 domain-containing protein [Burkholderia gladioli]